MGEAVDAPKADETPESPPTSEKKERAKRFTLAGITAGLTLIGALWYGLQSLVAAWVYDPLGVKPRDVGLSSGALLTQSTVGLIAFLLVSLIVMLIVVVYLEIRSKETRSDPFALMIKAPLAAIFAVILWFILTPFVFAVLADHARDSLQQGKRPYFVPGFPSPWQAEVAFLRRAGDRQIQLPDCALYLGQSDGTVVLFVKEADRTLRVPASAVALELDHDLRSCP